MSEQAVARLMQTLDCDDRQVGFVAYLPDAVQQELAQGVQRRLDADREELERAIAEGRSKMPGWLRVITGAILK